MMINALMDLPSPDVVPEPTMPEEAPFDDSSFPEDVFFFPEDTSGFSETDPELPFDATGVADSNEIGEALIGADARESYQDSSIPPGSGHAVALVGRGLDPATGGLQGFHVTDSNFPGGAHFIPTDQLAEAWYGNDMISIPETLSA